MDPSDLMRWTQRVFLTIPLVCSHLGSCRSLAPFHQHLCGTAGEVGLRWSRRESLVEDTLEVGDASLGKFAEDGENFLQTSEV